MASNSIVFRDLGKVLSERLGTNIDLNQILSDEFGDNFYSDMQSRRSALSTLDSELAIRETELRDLFKDSVYDSDSIIEGIKRFSFNGENDEVLSKNLALKLFGDGANTAMQGKAKDAILSYNRTYTNYFNAFVDDATKISKVGAAIREDKMVYTVGVMTGKGKLKEFILDSQQWDKFMHQRESFGLYRDEKGNISLGLHHSLDGKYSREYGLNASTLASNLQRAISGDTMSGRKALALHGVSDVRQEIWDALKNSEIFSQSSIVKFWETGNSEDLVSLYQSRKYEILNSGIWDPVYQKGLSAESRAAKIQEILSNQQSQGFILENVYGGARGDNMLAASINGDNFATQQKFFGNAGNIFGFSIMSYAAMDNALSFYSNEKMIAEESERIAENIANSRSGQQAIEAEGRLLAYQQGAYMLADMGLISYEEADEIAEEAAEQSSEEEFSEEE